ncbi:MAG: lactonase family protein [Paludibacter sp.]|nr:lactonase family protein [Paludibacter sp.]
MKKAAVFFLIISCLFANAQNKTYRFLVGTFTVNTPSEGIYAVELNPAKNIYAVKCIAKGVKNPSFLTISPDSNFVYAVNESGELSTISAWKFNKLSGELTLINKVSAGGPGPCYIAANDKHVVTANYSGGSLVVFGRNNDGTLTEAKQIIRHYGGSINPKRQTSAHVHQTVFSPDNEFVLTNDLGTDYVNVYKYNQHATDEILISFDSLLVKPGSGPRHLTFNNTGKIIYVLQELDGTVSVINFENGKLNLMQETTVIRNNDLENGAADIHLSPDEKFIYATNRGSVNNITCFKVLKNGKLKFAHQVSTMGVGPRNFTITKDGKFLLVGNQRSNEIVVFKRNIATGKLKDANIRINIGAPVCLVEY